jgi:hypothetical protein
MPNQPVTELENMAIDDVVRGWRSWARARGLDPEQPSHIDLHAFALFLARRAGESSPLPLPGGDDEDYAARIQRAMALRGFA